MKRVILIVTIAAALAFAVFRIGPIAVAQSSSSAPSTKPREQALSMQDMMKMHEKMMADMKAADARLDALVSRGMNAAKGAPGSTPIAGCRDRARDDSRRPCTAAWDEMHQHMIKAGGMMMNR